MEKLENELAYQIFHILRNHITTGAHENGQGKYLDCTINFRYLKNEGAILVKDLNFKSKESDYNKHKNQTETIPYINELNCSERLRNVLNVLMYGFSNRKLDNIFKTYTKERIRNTRGMGEKSMKELDELRIKYNLKYK